MKKKFHQIVILGSGESGTGAAILAKAIGATPFVSDIQAIEDRYKEKLIQANIDFEEGVHTVDKMLQADLIIKSPGIALNKLPFYDQIKKQKIKVIGEIEFAAYYTESKKIAITGTNGKTTTTLLTYHFLKSANYNVYLAGNIGNSFAELVAKEISGEISKENLWYVLEISSFMLDDMFDFKANIGVITNITPDHLDRYDYKINKYVDSKFRVLQNMDSSCYFIYGEDSKLIANKLVDIDTDAIELPFSIYPDEFDGACGDENSFTIQYNGELHELSLSKSPLKGVHNLYNTMAAGLAAFAAGVSTSIIQDSLASFVNHPHRMQHVGVLNGVTYINDSKATNVDSAYYALDSIKETIVWIAGGIDKGNDYTILAPVVKGKVETLVCLGLDNNKLIQSFKNIIPNIISTDSMSACLDICMKVAKPGSVVLLSPCCASFDLFKNYEDRGNQFMQQVKMRIQC